MKKYNYIIVGGGMAGSAAVMGIREIDKTGSIAMFSKEPYGPYNRPPLTKGLWNGTKIDDITRDMTSYDVELHLNMPVTKIAPEEKEILIASGDSFAFDKLLLATGGSPVKLPASPEGVVYFRTREDYQALRELVDVNKNFCVIGGGFIGSEISAALANQGKQVTIIFPEVGISDQIFPGDLARFLNKYYQDHGIEVLEGNLVQSIDQIGDRFRVTWKNVTSDVFNTKEFDGVVIGIGIKPNQEIAEKAKIHTADGILVNETLQTNYEDIFAAGDVANFFNPHLGTRTRVEHEDNANTMGTTAGKNMAGASEVYNHFPFFYSDLFDLGYEAVGELNKEYEIFSNWIVPYQKGTIYYLKESKIRGLVFWNLWGNVDLGREVISAGKTYTKDELVDLFTDKS